MQHIVINTNTNKYTFLFMQIKLIITALEWIFVPWRKKCIKLFIQIIERYKCTNEIKMVVKHPAKFLLIKHILILDKDWQTWKNLQKRPCLGIINIKVFIWFNRLYNHKNIFEILFLTLIQSLSKICCLSFFKIDNYSKHIIPNCLLHIYLMNSKYFLVVCLYIIHLLFFCRQKVK